jgi:4-nitrophenyl phosphatase
MAGSIGEDIDALVCDLDGVIYRGSDPIPGAAEAIERLRERGVRVLFCTNNSRSTVGDYLAKLDRMGIPTPAGDIVTSATVTAEVLQRRGFAGKTAIVVGGDGVREALSSVCISVKDDPTVRRADVVVVGFDPTFTYDAMRRATYALLNGAAFVATNDDPAFPAEEGLWPGAGAILASIETASGRSAEIMGKPHPPMMDIVAARLGPDAKVLVVGDRPDTDLAGGAARGWPTALVLTGVTAGDDVDGVTPKPDLVLGSIAELVG